MGEIIDEKIEYCQSYSAFGLLTAIFFHNLLLHSTQISQCLMI
jgi:hypothetical protein